MKAWLKGGMIGGVIALIYLIYSIFRDSFELIDIMTQGFFIILISFAIGSFLGYIYQIINNKIYKKTNLRNTFLTIVILSFIFTPLIAVGLYMGEGGIGIYAIGYIALFIGILCIIIWVILWIISKIMKTDIKSRSENK